MSSFIKSLTRFFTRQGGGGMALIKAKEIVASNPVVVFSKTYCPFCIKVKELFSSIGAKPKVVELDTEADGADLQAALAEWTGQRTIPSVFVGGKHIGGCDDTTKKHNSGQLVPMLKDAGVSLK